MISHTALLTLSIEAPGSVPHLRSHDSSLQPSSNPSLHARLCTLHDRGNVQCDHIHRWRWSTNRLALRCSQHCPLLRLHRLLLDRTGMSQLLWPPMDALLWRFWLCSLCRLPLVLQPHAKLPIRHLRWFVVRSFCRFSLVC